MSEKLLLTLESCPECKVLLNKEGMCDFCGYDALTDYAKYLDRDKQFNQKVVRK